MSQKHIIFDFDGVIGDTFALNWELVLALHPGVTEEQYRIFHHMGNVFEKPAVPFTEETATEYYRLYNERLSLVHVARALPFLKELGKDYRLHIVSSNCEVAIRRVLTEGGVVQCFGHILGKEAHESKVEKFQHIARIESISLSDALFVTDTLGDLKEAHKVGLHSCAVTFGYHSRDILSQGNPECVVDTWEEVFEKIYLLNLLDKGES